MIPIMNAFDDPAYSQVYCSCGSQMGKSEAMLNIFGKRFDDGPRVPALMIQPNEKLTRSFSNDRVMKMVDSTKNLAARMDRGQANKVTEKFIAGIRWGFGWAGSATELASHPAGLVILDEVDRMAGDIKKEGDPVILASARLKNYYGSKLGCFSTPTTWPGSKITQLWYSGTMGKWAWKCPGCKGWLIPQESILKWPKGASIDQVEKLAYIECPECKEKINTAQRNRLNAKGRYEYHRVKDPDADEIELERLGADPPENKTASFWVSGLASPWQTFGEIAAKMAAAYRSKDQDSIKAAKNTYCGECYEIRGIVQPWRELNNLIGQYEPGSVPDGVQLITLGADVQKLGFYYVIRGWGFNQESWKIENGFIAGETEFLPVWSLMATVLEKQFDGIRIKRAFIDSGYNSNQVYLFARRFPGLAYPTKGQDNQVRPLIMSKVDLSVNGKIMKGGVKLFHTDTDFFKAWLFSRYRWPVGDPGAFHLDSGTQDDYLKQITAEQLVITDKGKRTWQQIRTDNHYLDAEVNALAAAHSLQAHSLPAQPARNKTQVPAGGMPPPRKSFVGGRSGFVRR